MQKTGRHTLSSKRSDLPFSLATLGAEWLLAQLQFYRGRFYLPTKVIFLALIIAFPVRKGIQECVKFNDPVYSLDLAHQASRYAAELAKNNNLFWVGPFYTVHPKDFVFDRENEFAYVYHLHRHVVQ